jgi:hypothetical protein
MILVAAADRSFLASARRHAPHTRLVAILRIAEVPTPIRQQAQPLMHDLARALDIDVVCACLSRTSDRGGTAMTAEFAQAAKVCGHLERGLLAAADRLERALVEAAAERPKTLDMLKDGRARSRGCRRSTYSLPRREPRNDRRSSIRPNREAAAAISLTAICAGWLASRRLEKHCSERRFARSPNVKDGYPRLS